MVKQSIAEKGIRLLATDRVKIVAADKQSVRARVGGDHDTYDVTYVAGLWTCSCPAVRDCSHLSAVKRITAVDLIER